MRLSDIMGAFDLSTMPQIALTIFLGVFVAVCAKTLFGRDRYVGTDPATLPLADDTMPASARNHHR